MTNIHLLLCTLFLLTACGKKNGTTDNGSGETAGPAINISSVPMRPGYTWVYDSGDTIRVGADTVINGIAACQVVKTNNGGKAISYYANRTDGFYLLGTNAKPYAFGGNGFYADSAILFNNPILLAKFPVTLQKEWDTRVPLSKNDLRKWASYVTITTKAGRFNCIKLSGNHIDEYYSLKGIVRIVNYVDCITAPCPPVVTDLVSYNF